MFNVLLTLIEVKWILHGIRHPWSDGPSGKADALQKVDYYFQDFNQSMFPSQVTRGERVSVTFNLRIFHVFRTKYRNTCKIYKKQLNKAYYEYINNLIETPSSDQPKKFWRFVKSKRQNNIGINTLEEDNTNASDNYGKANVLNDY